MNRFKILTYNIHKGFNTANTAYMLKQIKKSVRASDADLVFLQEVIGHHDQHRKHMDDWPTGAQFEYLSDEVWPHFAYGKNAFYTEGHHGNAILSKYPISHFENEDVSFSRIERRGILHAVIPHGDQELHAFCIHLGLFEKDRKKQVQRLCSRIARHVPHQSPLIIAGDFNDWNRSAGKIIETELTMKESFFEIHGKHALTFPSFLPVLPLDRIYYRNLKCLSADRMRGPLWNQQSDHLPLIAEFEIPGVSTP
jgi:endonuclease/exonuclease/phosphatase family metal-dependent hydrolase